MTTKVISVLIKITQFHGEFNLSKMEEETITSILKVLFMILFFGIVCFVGTLPLRSKAFKSNPKLRIFGSTFAGALFINVAILHILPESADTLENYLRDGQKTEDGDDIEVFPLANLLLMVGFLITIFFTKILTKHQHLPHQVACHDEQTHPSHDSKCQNHEGHAHENQQGFKTESISESLITSSDLKEIKKVQKKKSSLNEAYVLTIAIYFHTIFEGIAIGVQQNLTEFLGIAIAIAFHKWADALSMGCHYKSRNIPKKTANYLIIGQAILNVLSIGLGWIISLQGDVLEAVFLSISAGTFLAISTMELLSEQLHHRQYQYQKFGLIIISTMFISAVWFIENRLF